MSSQKSFLFDFEILNKKLFNQELKSSHIWRHAGEKGSEFMKERKECPGSVPSTVAQGNC